MSDFGSLFDEIKELGEELGEELGGVRDDVVASITDISAGATDTLDQTVKTVNQTVQDVKDTTHQATQHVTKSVDGVKNRIIGK